MVRFGCRFVLSYGVRLCWSGSGGGHGSSRVPAGFQPQDASAPDALDTQMGALGGVFLNLFVYVGFSLTIAYLAHREPSGIPDVSIELVGTAD